VLVSGLMGFRVGIGGWPAAKGGAFPEVTVW